MPRINLSPREAELISAFRAERNIYNSAITDVLTVLEKIYSTTAEGRDFLADATPHIMAVRKQD